MTGNFVSLYKTCKKGDTSVLKLKCAWESGELNILVIDGNTAWSGKFTAEEIESFCEVLGITRDEYITECQQAFSGGETVENYLFAVESNRFVWRKELGADTRVKFGSIKLSPVPLVHALEEFVDFAFENIKRCRQEVTEAKNKMGYFETERTILVQKLEEYTQNKKEIENILYSKFLCILNAKKERIATLEQQLSDLKSKLQLNTSEIESHKCDTVVAAKRNTKTTRQTKEKNIKPQKRRVRPSPPSIAVDTALLLSSNVPGESSDTQTDHSSEDKELSKQNIRQTGPAENIITSCKQEESEPCTSKSFFAKVCEQQVLENTGATGHQPSKNDTVQQKTLVLRSVSPVASTSTAVIPLESHVPMKYETPDQLVQDEKELCIISRPRADQKSQPLVKKCTDELTSKQIKDVSESVNNSELKDKTTRKISEVICPIDLVSQKINTKSDVSQNNVNKLTVTKNNKKVITSPAKQCKEFEIISPLEMLVQSKPLTSSVVHKDTVCLSKSHSLKRPMQPVNMQDNSSHEFSTERTNVCQEAVEGSAERFNINYENTNSIGNTADTTSTTTSSVNHIKIHADRESNHYDSDTDVDEPEYLCKLSDKHRSVSDILHDSNHSSLAESENPEAKCDEINQSEQKKAIEDLLNDSQDSNSTAEEISMAPLPKRTRRSERINKVVPMINKSVNHFTKLSNIRDKNQNASENVHSILYGQETQIVDTQKLLDELD